MWTNTALSMLIYSQVSATEEAMEVATPPHPMVHKAGQMVGASCQDHSREVKLELEGLAASCSQVETYILTILRAPMAPILCVLSQ